MPRIRRITHSLVYYLDLGKQGSYWRQSDQPITNKTRTSEWYLVRGMLLTPSERLC